MGVKLEKFQEIIKFVKKIFKNSDIKLDKFKLQKKKIVMTC